MRELNDHINNLCIKSKRMRSVALDIHGEKSIKIKEEQDKIYKELQFLRELRTAMNKERKKNEN